MCHVKIVFSRLWISSSHGLVPQIESWQGRVSTFQKLMCFMVAWHACTIGSCCMPKHINASIRDFKDLENTES